MPQPIDVFCKQAIKKEYTNINKLSFILAQDEQYGDEVLTNLWKNLDMDLRDKKEPELSSPTKKVGTWFKILNRVISSKNAGIYQRLDNFKRLTSYDENQETGELQQPLSGKSGGFIKLCDLKYYFENQFEIDLPSKLFPLQGCSISREGANSGYIQKGETVDDKLENFISWVKSEVELFYLKLKGALKASGENVGDATQSKALDVFDKNRNSFDKIEEEDIQGDFYGGDHPTRAKGLIANKIMGRVDPDLFLKLKSKANAQKLDKLLRKKPME